MCVIWREVCYLGIEVRMIWGRRWTKLCGDEREGHV